MRRSSLAAALLLLAQIDASSAPFVTKAELQAAVRMWVDGRATALSTYGPISGWDVSSITDMSELFRDLANFNDELSSWDTSSVTSMQGMFWVRSARAPPATTAVGPSQRAACATAASYPPATRPACRSFYYASLSTRQGARAFNQPLRLDTSSVTSMLGMFDVRSARGGSVTTRESEMLNLNAESG